MKFWKHISFKIKFLYFSDTVRSETPDGTLVDIGAGDQRFVDESFSVDKPQITTPEVSLHFSFDEDLLVKNPHGVSPSLLLQARKFAIN